MTQASKQFGKSDIVGRTVRGLSGNLIVAGYSLTRGRTLEISEEVYEATVNRRGESYLDRILDPDTGEQAQMARYGSVVLAFDRPEFEGMLPFERGDALWQWELQKALKAASELPTAARMIELNAIRQKFGTISLGSGSYDLRAGV